MSNNQNTKLKVIKPENIIYESENGTNVIVDNGSTYILSHKNGICCCFDRNDKILKRVIKAIEQDGNFQVNDKNILGFYVADNTGKMKYTLGQLVISTVYHKPISYIRRGKTRYLNSNVLDCCLANLDNTKISNAVSSPYTVSHDDKYIYIEHNNGQIGKLTYYQELYKIVKYQCRWDYQKSMNTFYTVITRKHSKEKIYLTLHQLAYIFYHYQNVTHRNILSNIRSYKANFTKYNLEVDHLDSQRMNDCEYNISAMYKSLNSSKSNITAKIIAPFFHYAVYVNDTYSVAIGMYMDGSRLDGKDEVKIQMYQCNTAELYVELLKRFYNEGVLPHGERKNGT